MEEEKDENKSYKVYSYKFTYHPVDSIASQLKGLICINSFNKVVYRKTNSIFGLNKILAVNEDGTNSITLNEGQNDVPITETRIINLMIDYCKKELASKTIALPCCKEENKFYGENNISEDSNYSMQMKYKGICEKPSHDNYSKLLTTKMVILISIGSFLLLFIIITIIVFVSKKRTQQKVRVSNLAEVNLRQT